MNRTVPRRALFFTKKGVGIIGNCSVRTVDKYIKEGRLVVVRIDRQVLITRESVLALFSLTDEQLDLAFPPEG